MPKGVYKRKPFTPRHCAALSAAKMGKKNPMFGHEYTEEERDVLSSAHTGISFSPEHCAAISAAKMGHEVSDETRELISAPQRGIPRPPGTRDAMIGGNDICNHHFIYDHDYPENHTVPLTRSQHSAHHHWMRRNGLKVPHLNMTDENKDIFK